jgi:hypothetical protein
MGYISSLPSRSDRGVEGDPHGEKIEKKNRYVGMLNPLFCNTNSRVTVITYCESMQGECSGGVEFDR